MRCISQFLLRTNFKLVVLLLVMSCAQFKPETIGSKLYPQIDVLLTIQTQSVAQLVLKKSVWLDGKSESKEFELDSAGWLTELSFLKEINPNQAEYVGAFNESRANGLVLTLSDGENGSLKKFTLSESDSTLITAIIHEDKDIFVHHREIEISFKDGLISRYLIEGYQKILYKDSIKFRIEGKIINP